MAKPRRRNRARARQVVVSQKETPALAPEFVQSDRSGRWLLGRVIAATVLLVSIAAIISSLPESFDLAREQRPSWDIRFSTPNGPAGGAEIPLRVGPLSSDLRAVQMQLAPSECFGVAKAAVLQAFPSGKDPSAYIPLMVSRRQLVGPRDPVPAPTRGSDNYLFGTEWSAIVPLWGRQFWYPFDSYETNVTLRFTTSDGRDVDVSELTHHGGTVFSGFEITNFTQNFVVDKPALQKGDGGTVLLIRLRRPYLSIVISLCYLLLSFCGGVAAIVWASSRKELFAALVGSGVAAWGVHQIVGATSGLAGGGTLMDVLIVGDLLLMGGLAIARYGAARHREFATQGVGPRPIERVGDTPPPATSPTPKN